MHSFVANTVADHACLRGEDGHQKAGDAVGCDPVFVTVALVSNVAAGGSNRG